MLVGCHQRDQSELREVFRRQRCDHVLGPGIPPRPTPVDAGLPCTLGVKPVGAQFRLPRPVRFQPCLQVLAAHPVNAGCSAISHDLALSTLHVAALFTLMPVGSTPHRSVQVSGFDDFGHLTPMRRLLSASCSSGQRFAIRLPSDSRSPAKPLPSANSSPCRASRGLSPPSGCALPGAPKKTP